MRTSDLTEGEYDYRHAVREIVARGSRIVNLEKRLASAEALIKEFLGGPGDRFFRSMPGTSDHGTWWRRDGHRLLPAQAPNYLLKLWKEHDRLKDENIRLKQENQGLRDLLKERDGVG